MGAVLGDPLLRALKVGDHVDLVVKVFEQLSHGSRAVAMWHDEACMLRGNCLPVGIWTLYGYQISGFGSDGAELQVCSESACFQRPAVDAGAFTRVKEVCAGLGGISLGAHAAGGTSLAFVEKCDIACQALVRNHGKVIQGDLTERHVRMQLHSVAPSTACVIAAGTPCQGFSVQGFGRGLQDSRSLTLLSVLQTTWLHQAYGLVLERYRNRQTRRCHGSNLFPCQSYGISSPAGALGIRCTMGIQQTPVVVCALATVPR